MVRLGDVIKAIEGSWRTASVRLDLRGHDRQWRYWQRGELRRLETDPGGEIQVARPGVCWRSSPGEGVLEYHNTTMSFGLPETLVDITDLLRGRLTLKGESEIAGRSAVRLAVTARPVSADQSSRPHDDLDTEIWVDVQRGVGLRTANLEVTAIAYDEALDDQLFQAPTATASTPADPQIVPQEGRRLTQDEAVSQSPFPLLTPTRLPAGTRLLTWMDWTWPNFKWIGALYVVEPGPYCAITLHLADHASPTGPDTAWRTVDVGGSRVSVARDDQNPLARSVARIERAGVIVTLQSALPVEVLAEIAASVEPL